MSENKIRIAVRKYEPFEIALQKMWKKFVQKTKCDFIIEAIPMDLHDLYNEILSEKQGLKNGAWDIAYINTDWLAEAYETKSVVNLERFISEQPPEDFPNAWAKSLLETQEFGSNIIGLPFHDGPECLIYRRDLFESDVEKKNFLKETGKELSLPKTWQDFCKVARFFHRPKDNLSGTVFAAYPDGHNTVFDFCIQLWSRGGKLCDDNGKIIINSQQAIEGLDFYCDVLTDSSLIHPKSFELDSVKSGVSFSKGEVAMMINWFGFASMSEVLETSTVKGKVGITDIPHVRGVDPISLNAYWMYCIGAGSTHKKVSYDFISYAVNAENDKKLTLEGGIGCRKSTWNDEEVNKVIPYYSKLNQLHKNPRMLPRRTDWFKISQVIDSVVLEAFKKEKSIKEILDIGQEKINAINNNSE